MDIQNHDDESLRRHMSQGIETTTTSTTRLKMTLITYNIGSQFPDHIPLERFFKGLFLPQVMYQDTTADIYVIGTQENKYIIRWETLLGDLLYRFNFDHVASAVLKNIHVVIFAKRRYVHEIRRVETSTVATGIGNIVGNKGAAAVSLTLRGGKKILLVAAHFTAHCGKVRERNKDYKRITRELFFKKRHVLKPPTRRRLTKKNIIHDENNYSLSSKTRSTISSSIGAAAAFPKFTDYSAFLTINRDEEAILQQRQHCHSHLDKMKRKDVTEMHHMTFWIGDLNYRVNGKRDFVERSIEEGISELLVSEDQLAQEMCKGNVFKGFKEGKLTFPPTYKYNVGSNVYDTSQKKRVPSWTDRILWKVRSDIIDSDAVKLCSYESMEDLQISDHRPVIATFEIKLNLPKKKINNVDFGTLKYSLKHLRRNMSFMKLLDNYYFNRESE